MTHYRLWWLAAVVGIVCSSPALPDEANILDVATVDAQEAAKQFGVAPVKISLNAGDEIRALADGSVEIGTARLQNITSGNSPKDAMLIRRFVLGHELWHVHQIQVDRIDVFKNSSQAQRLMLECQADLMGAVFAASVPSNDLKALGSSIHRLLQVARELGTHGLPGDLHPTVEQRETAVQLGLARVIASAIHADTQGNADASLLALNLEKVADVRVNEDSPAWSWRVCKKIVHDDPGALKKLSFPRPDILFSERGDAPFVSYQVPVTNRSDRPLQVSLTIVSSVVELDNDRHPVLSTRTIATVENFDFTLDPYATIFLQGTLQWTTDGKRKPMLETDMGNPYAMISAEFSGPSHDISCLAQIAPGMTADQKAIRSLIQRVASSALTNFSAVVSGQPNASSSSVLYDILLTAPGLSNGYASVRQDGSAQASFTAYEGTDPAHAVAIYERLKSQLEGICPRSYVQWSEHLYKDLPIAIVEHLSRNASLSVRTLQRSDGKYEVSLDIEKVLDM
ncbi:hypothetical protein [Paraburkholderia flagellata]|uniref:hypothetical protein n=1 Tax=Paraburkholderia flagellata TaxID=2883241 RepID=UPI001F1A6A25|nr:hypothetical protein [Paraburkholderia flagellata]